MQCVQQLIQWISALHRPFQAIKGRCYTRGSDYTWCVHRKWVIWNRINELFIDNVSESIRIQILFIHIKCDPVQRCSFISSACALAQDVRHILHIKASWTAAQHFILPNYPTNSCESLTYPIILSPKKFWTRVIFICGFRLLCIKKSPDIFIPKTPSVDCAKLPRPIGSLPNMETFWAGK